MTREPVQARAQRRRDSLLDAAQRLLAREGFAAINTNAVAREASAAIGTVYDYFPNKAALLAALLERYRARLRAALLTALGRDGADADADNAALELDAIVERGVRAFADFYRREPGYAQLWLGSQLSAPLREAGASWGHEFAELLAPLIRERARDPRTRRTISKRHAQRVALALVHAVSAVVSLALTKGARERDALIDESVSLAQAYLARRPKPRRV